MPATIFSTRQEGDKSKGSISRDYVSVSLLPISFLDVAVEIVDAILELVGF